MSPRSKAYHKSSKMADAVADDDVTLPRGNVKMFFLLLYLFSTLTSLDRTKDLSCFIFVYFMVKRGLFVRFCRNFVLILTYKYSKLTLFL